MQIINQLCSTRLFELESFYRRQRLSFAAAELIRLKFAQRLLDFDGELVHPFEPLRNYSLQEQIK